ncbi:hypothetical protein CWE14_11660 [Aliidiomarina soli]|uniref:Uncharacterized protein n=2 Tax=Aliidiomarina soli TaxID=1928574 RepID=A0A432WES3_9GAMM|nr:hypothetical protein CWE14_11660 [Aliidiomarina soli]
MRTDDLVKTLIELGWFCSKDEVGDVFCLTKIDDRIIQIIPSLSKRSDHFRVSLAPSISTEKFSDAVSFIIGRDVEFEPIVVSNFPVKKIKHPDQSDIDKLSKEAIEWALSQNIIEALENYRNMPTNAKGARPLRHLASLSVFDDVYSLQRYKDSFEKGDRLDFVPYITVDMISRALMFTGKEIES